MSYTLYNKVTGQEQRTLSKKELHKVVDMFVAFNPSRGKLDTLDKKLAYYNKKSFYTVKGA